MTRRPGGPPSRPRTIRFAVVVAVLLVTPLVLGLSLGWYSLNPPVNEMSTPTGSEAHALLGGFPATRMVVEIAYQSNGLPPSAAALAVLGARINETCSHSSLSWSIHSFASSKTSFTSDDLLALTVSNREVWPGPGTMSLFYLFTSGSFADQANVLGEAFRGSSIAVFGGTLAANAPAGELPAVTATVIVHEFGHELGLVGIVGSAPNEDLAHPFHSNDPNDVMYWSVETTASLLGLFGGSSPPTDFDVADVSDLATVKSTLIPLEVIPWVVLGAVAIGVAVVSVLHVRSGRTRTPADAGPAPADQANPPDPPSSPPRRS